MSDASRLLANILKARWVSYMPARRRSGLMTELTIGEKEILVRALKREVRREQMLAAGLLSNPLRGREPEGSE